MTSTHTGFICETCGTQYPPSIEPPAGCPICLDARQFVGHDGQRWISPAQLAETHHNRIEEIAPGLYGIGTEPGFAIGQRALLLRTPQGNVLWDCVSLLDGPTTDAIAALGGIDTVVISHPHFYTAMGAWAETFNARIVLPAADREWVMNTTDAIESWSGDSLVLADGLTLLRCGGHFPGAAVLHWTADAPGNTSGRGMLLTGDTVQVCADRDWVSFMYSYPNMIPLPAFEIQRIAEQLAPLSFDDLYGGWWPRVVRDQADAKVKRSAQRYLAALVGDFHRAD